MERQNAELSLVRRNGGSCLRLRNSWRVIASLFVCWTLSDLTLLIAHIDNSEVLAKTGVRHAMFEGVFIQLPFAEVDGWFFCGEPSAVALTLRPLATCLLFVFPKRAEGIRAQKGPPGGPDPPPPPPPPPPPKMRIVLDPDESNIGP